MLIAFSVSGLTSGRKKQNNLSWRKDKSDSWYQLFNADEWVLPVRVLVGGGGGGLRTFTFLQICRPERRGRCCGSEASLRCAAASGPSGEWRWRPASPAPPKAPTPTGCRSARPRCPPDAWRKVRRTGRGSEAKNTVSNADRGKCGGVKDDKIFIVDLWGIKSKSRNSPSNNITPYVTSKHLRPLKQHVGGVFKSNSGS